MQRFQETIISNIQCEVPERDQVIINVEGLRRNSTIMPKKLGGSE